MLIFVVIIAKLLATILKKVMHNMIQTYQSAFVKIGKCQMVFQLSINLWISQKRQRRECILLNIDFKNACYNVSWDYPRNIMRRIGFGVGWLRWMEASVFEQFNHSSQWKHCTTPKRTALGRPFVSISIFNGCRRIIRTGQHKYFLL